jgi:hypothetical protein
MPKKLTTEILTAAIAGFEQQKNASTLKLRNFAKC